jgi:hypothetical protein
MQQGRYIAHKFESGWEVGVIKAFDEGPSRWQVQEGPSRWQVQREVQGYCWDDPIWWTHSLLREGYAKDKHWVLLGLPGRDSA